MKKLISYIDLLAFLLLILFCINAGFRAGWGYNFIFELIAKKDLTIQYYIELTAGGCALFQLKNIKKFLPRGD